MKYFSFLLLFLTACTTTIPSTKENEKIVTFSAQLGGWTFHDSVGIIFVKATLYNNSPDTLTYLRMDCSWADSYTTDNDTFKIVKNPCYKNGPMTMQLPPYKSEDEYLRIETRKNIQGWQHSTFRVGLNFVALDSTRDVPYNVDMLTDMQHIFWSDTLQLAHFWKWYR